MSEVKQVQEANGGREFGSSSDGRPTGNGTRSTQNVDFQVKGMGNESANGGTVNTGRKSELMSYTEYTGKKGTDGFSKNGGKR